ncbi:MAG: DUF4105 domain-containing protein, partial [Pseudomonadota bacterium]
DVLDRAINYGAASSEDDALIPYIAKGLVGGYRSTYTSLQFFHQAERYRERELRTIWQYRLDLSPEEVELLLGHLYELLETRNRYYFLRQNCAWRLAETLELVVDRDLIPDNKLWVTPIDIFHQLTADDPDGGEAVADLKRIASRETLFLEGYRELSRDKQELVNRVVARPERPLTQHATDLLPPSPAAAYDVLLDYYAYTADTPAEEARQKEVTLARLALPPSPAPRDQRRRPPHTGQRPSMVQVSFLSNERLGEGVELRLRPAYFDLLSGTVGTVPYSEVAMGDARFVIRDGNINLRSLDVVRVTNLSPRTADRPDAGNLSWRVRVGAEDRDLACDKCLLGFAEFGAGKALELQRGLAAYAFLTGRLEAGRNAPSIASVRPSVGLLHNTRGMAFLAEAGFHQGADQFDESRPLARTEIRFGTGQRWDVRLSSGYDRTFESGAAFSFYW